MAHEQVGQGDVRQNLPGRVDLKIARRQAREMRLQLLFADGRSHEPADLPGQRLAVFFLGANEGGAARELLHRFVVEQQQQRILEPVPQLVAGAERVGHRVEREQFQVLGALNLRGKIADDGRVVQIAALGNLAHGQVMLDDQSQRVRGGAVEVETSRDPLRQLAADLGMSAGARGFARVMQQQRQVKHEGPFHAAENFRVIAVRRFLRLPNPVELFETNQGVLVGGVLVIKLVLHQAGQFAELRQVFAEQPDVVHRAQNGRHIAALIEDFQKRFPHVPVPQKRAVHQGKLVANQLRQVGVRLQAALKDALGNRINIAAHQPETIHQLLAEPIAAGANQFTEGRQPPLGMRQ